MAPAVFKTVEGNHIALVGSIPSLSATSFILKRLRGISLVPNLERSAPKGALSAQLVPINEALLARESDNWRTVTLKANLSAQLVAKSATVTSRIVGWSLTILPCRRNRSLWRLFQGSDVGALLANFLVVEHDSSTIKTAQAPVLMDKRELADWLCVCVKTIDNWLLEGWLPVIQPSPRIQRFNPVQILKTMEELHGRGHGYEEEAPIRRNTIHALSSS